MHSATVAIGSEPGITVKSRSKRNVIVTVELALQGREDGLERGAVRAKSLNIALTEASAACHRLVVEARLLLR